MAWSVTPPYPCSCWLARHRITSQQRYFFMGHLICILLFSFTVHFSQNFFFIQSIFCRANFYLKKNKFLEFKQTEQNSYFFSIISSPSFLFLPLMVTSTAKTKKEAHWCMGKTRKILSSMTQCGSKTKIPRLSDIPPAPSPPHVAHQRSTFKFFQKQKTKIEIFELKIENILLKQEKK